MEKRNKNKIEWIIYGVIQKIFSLLDFVEAIVTIDKFNRYILKFESVV